MDEDPSVRVHSMPVDEAMALDEPVPEKTPSTLYDLQITKNKGYGLFATRPIPAGTRILAESPFLTCHTNEKMILMDEFDKLTPEQHAAYTELSYNRRSVEPQQEKAIRARLANTRQYGGKALIAAVEDSCKMHAIFFTNAVQMGVKSKYGHGLFLLYSRLNHSCRPNVQNSYNATLGKETVHAIRDIEAGEELCTSYTINVRTKELRQEHLAVGWGFECVCEVCSGSGEEAAKSEKRRKRMFEIDQGLAVFDKGDAVLMMLTPGKAPRSEKEALFWAEELVGVLKEEGLVGMDLAQAYRECSKFSLREGLREKAIAYAKKEVEIERICIGDDTDHLKADLEGAKFWLDSIENVSEQGAIKMRMNEKRNQKEQKKADKKAAKKATKGKR